MAIAAVRALIRICPGPIRISTHPIIPSLHLTSSIGTPFMGYVLRIEVGGAWLIFSVLPVPGLGIVASRVHDDDEREDGKGWPNAGFAAGLETQMSTMEIWARSG